VKNNTKEMPGINLLISLHYMGNYYGKLCDDNRNDVMNMLEFF